MERHGESYADLCGSADSHAAPLGKDGNFNNNLITSVALAPKTSADQQGLFYEGKDYRALGEIADVLLMTYEWGYI